MKNDFKLRWMFVPTHIDVDVGYREFILWSLFLWYDIKVLNECRVDVPGGNNIRKKWKLLPWPENMKNR